MRQPIFDPPIIAIDFDGTIVDNEYPEIGEVKDGAREFINMLKEEGYRVVIWTCRDNEEEIKEFLDENNVQYDAFNSNDAISEEEMNELGFEDTRKIGADIVIDDRAIEFKGNWHEITARVKRIIDVWEEK